MQVLCAIDAHDIRGSPLVLHVGPGADVGTPGAPDQRRVSGARAANAGVGGNVRGQRVRGTSDHICTGTGLTPATTAPGPGSPLLLPHLHRDWARPCRGVW